MTLIKILFKFIEIILKFGCGFNGGVKNYALLIIINHEFDKHLA